MKYQIKDNEELLGYACNLLADMASVKGSLKVELDSEVRGVRTSTTIMIYQEPYGAEKSYEWKNKEVKDVH